ncbi:MAG TPA: hypothetical protein VGO39_00335 [Gaiellaceae bacterium]|nr:hypothetical protein [Gaiellaceae bacterium]
MLALAVGVALVPLLVRRGSGAPPQLPLTVAADLTPRAHLFGDRVRADVTVAFDPRRVDPQTVTIDASFAPYTPVGNARVVREPTSARLDVTLVCLTAACAAGAPQRAIAFGPAHVRYRDRSGRPHSAEAAWPPLLAASRLTPADRRLAQIRVAAALPRASAALDPTLVGRGLLVAAVALLLATGAALVRRRRERPAAVLAPVEVPALRSALAAVEQLAHESDGKRRSAIDLLARELGPAGLARLAPAARELAWSPPAPSAEPMLHLSTEVQKAVGSV